jgi:hypothetical protein
VLAAGDTVTLHALALSDMITNNFVAVQNEGKGSLWKAMYSSLLAGVLIRGQVRRVQYDCIPV